MKQTFLLIALFSQITTFSQIATIQNSNGLVNVHAGTTFESEILYKLELGELFWYGPEYRSDKSAWVEVYIPTSQFGDGYEISIVGQIQRKHLLLLDSITPYNGDDFNFKYFVSSFDSAGKSIEYIDEFLPVAINGKRIWGTDGSYPYNQVDSVTCSIESKTIKISPSLYVDLYNLRNEFKILKIQDSFIVYGWNSDGAGYYELGWVINKDGVQQRIVGSIY